MSRWGYTSALLGATLDGMDTGTALARHVLCIASAGFVPCVTIYLIIHPTSHLHITHIMRRLC